MDRPEPQLPPTIFLKWEQSRLNEYSAALPISGVPCVYSFARSVPGDHCHHWRLRGPQYDQHRKLFLPAAQDIGMAFDSERSAMVEADIHAHELLHTLAKPGTGSRHYTEARDLLLALSAATDGVMAPA